MTNKGEVIIYLLGALLGMVAGCLEVQIGDLLLTSLFVLASTMLLGVMRPQRPWRWMLVVAIFVPALQCLAYFALAEKPLPSEIYESFLGFLTGAAGAYAGAAGRGAWLNLMQKK